MEAPGMFALSSRRSGGTDWDRIVEAQRAFHGPEVSGLISSASEADVSEADEIEGEVSVRS